MEAIAFLDSSLSFNFDLFIYLVVSSFLYIWWYRESLSQLLLEIRWKYCGCMVKRSKGLFDYYIWETVYDLWLLLMLCQKRIINTGDTYYKFKPMEYAWRRYKLLKCCWSSLYNKRKSVVFYLVTNIYRSWQLIYFAPLVLDSKMPLF